MSIPQARSARLHPGEYCEVFGSERASEFVDEKGGCGAEELGEDVEPTSLEPDFEARLVGEAERFAFCGRGLHRLDITGWGGHGVW